MSLDKMFVVSSDVFEHYIRRDLDKWAYSECVSYTALREELWNYINISSDLFSECKLYNSTGHSFYTHSIILIEDYTAPKLTAKHWKDYSNL